MYISCKWCHYSIQFTSSTAWPILTNFVNDSYSRKYVSDLDFFMLNFNLTIYLWYIFWQNIFTISMETIEDMSCYLNCITNPHLSLRDDPRLLCLVRRRGRTPVSWAEGASPPGVPRAPPRSSPPSLYCSHCAVLLCVISGCMRGAAAVPVTLRHLSPSRLLTKATDV